jgi:hypothetical protein
MYKKFSTSNRAAKSKVINIIYFDEITALRTLLSHHDKKQITPRSTVPLQKLIARHECKTFLSLLRNIRFINVFRRARS